MKIKDITQLDKMLTDSDSYMQLLSLDFREKNERVLYRRKAQTVNDKFPNVLDNTLASYLEKIPKNVIQKLPDFTISTNSNKVVDLVSEFVAKEIIIKSGSKGYSFLQKQWIAFRNSNAYGMNAVALPFIFEDGDYSVGFENIYWGDLFLEPYTNNINSSNWVIYRTMLNEIDLQNIIDDEDEDVDDGWDKAAIENLIKTGAKTTTDSRGQKLVNSLHGIPEYMYELFVYSSKEETITFHHDSQTILRRVENPSGKQRVIGLYYDYDGINPFGRSLVDFAYDQQTMLDYLTQAYLYQVSYNLSPALKVKGAAINEDNFSLESGSVMFTGDAEGDISTIDLDNTTISNFPNIYSLVKSQLLAALPSSSDTGISAEAGNPTYSKTQAGVNNQERKEEVETNYSRKNYEQFFELYLENAINIYFAELKEMAGVVSIELNDEYANEIRNIDPELVDDSNTVILDLDTAPVINVSVDFESTRALAKEEDLKNLNTLITGMLEMGKSNPTSSAAIAKVLPLFFEEMLKNSNLESSAKISETLKTALAQAEQEQQQQQQIENNLKQQEVQAKMLPAQGGQNGL